MRFRKPFANFASGGENRVMIPGLQMLTDVEFRAARPDDAPALTRLIDMAGEGLPRWLWLQAAGRGQTPEDVGMERARRDTGGFSWRHACVLTCGGAVISLLLDYALDNPYELPDLTRMPEPVRPLVQLESLAPGAWYINAIATEPDWRGKGLARRLMMAAEARARAAKCQQMALIVAEENRGAVRLYDQLGYRELARGQLVPWPSCPHGGDYLLMVRSVE